MAAAAVLAAGCGTAASHAGASQAAAAPHTVAPAPSSAAPAPAPALSAKNQKYVNDVRGALANLGLTDGSTDAIIATAGHALCSGARVSSHGSAAIADKAMKRIALRILCPSKRPHVLIRFSGSGILNSAPFRVTTSTVSVRFTYNCASQGTGNFIADMETGNQASLGSDDQSIANALGAGDSQRTTLYPTDVGSMYHIAVNSECSWSLVVKSG